MRTWLVLLAAAISAAAQNLIIKNVTVIDANGPRPNATVAIAAGKIVARAPARATVIDGKGKYLIPALWDMHVHLWDSDPMLGMYVAAGVLGVRDMGSDLNRTQQLQRDVAAGLIVGPRIWTSGWPIDGPVRNNGGKMPVINAGNAEEGRKAVDKIDDAGADFIKVLSELSEDAFNAAAQRARVRRAVLVGHVPEAVSVWDAVDARMRSMEHLYGLAVAFSSEEAELRKRRAEAIAKKDNAALREIRSRAYATFSARYAAELCRRMGRMGVWQVPTLTLRKRLAYVDMDALVAAPELNYVPAAVRSTWTDPRKEIENATPEQLQNLRADWEYHRKIAGVLAQYGVDLLAGTDTGDPYVAPGFALHDELVLLVEAGLTPQAALNTATVNPARYFNLEDQYGAVQPGRVANLVLLDANPLADIHNTRRIHSVIVGGRQLDRAALDALLAGKTTIEKRGPIVNRPSKPASGGAVAPRNRGRKPRRVQR